MGTLTTWLEHYGYGLIFISLFLEMLALPLPGEMMMSYTGLFVFQGKLNWMLSILTASAGVTAGITLSYWIGYRLGQPFVTKYGHRIHLGEEQLTRMNVWFEKYGDKLLFVAYHFNSLGKVRFLVLASFMIFVFFVSLMLGLIQDFLAQEFNHFDEVVSYVVLSGFGPEWQAPMAVFAKLGSIYLYGPLIIITVLWIVFLARERLLELTFLFWVVIGGDLLDEGLRYLFHRPGPVAAGFRMRLFSLFAASSLQRETCENGGYCNCYSFVPPCRPKPDLF
ncbi:hypothetical protein PaeBR_03920 [Paenibacillus sp. BR2-3]|uniref:hypothetical protein n=1 Tax=Paenibacillus sp. BR2-3 TaxID=3048494 RepID=UPI0039774AA8